jgi:ABC-2 type transport system ATP-binding protein
LGRAIVARPSLLFDLGVAWVPHEIWFTQGKSMLVVDGIVKRYGSLTAVDGISFEVKAGECFGLLGPNGAGKTTTISMIAGVTTPDAGTLSLNGLSWSKDRSKVKQKIGYVPQELALYPEIDARENLRFFAALYGLFGNDCDRAVDGALQLVGLADRCNEPVSHFSGGMKRRLNIGAGLLHNPDLIVLDEPTVGIDPQSRNAIFETLENLRLDGRTLLYTTHYMEEVERLCRQVAIMDHGRIVEMGELQELKQRTGGSSLVAIQLEGDLPEKKRAELAAELGCQTEGPTFLVSVVDLTSDLPAILSKIGAKGLRVNSVKSSEATLEQVFLTMTGRKLRD